MSNITIDKNWAMALNVLARMASGNSFHTAYIWSQRPGIGKTWAAYQTAKKYYALTMTPETPASELRGFYMPEGGEFKWTDGVIIKAMREGSRAVINEVSHAGPDVLAFLHPILESAGTCRITLPTGETVVAAKGFHVVGTDNNAPQDLPEALASRWNIKLNLETYSPGGLAGLQDRTRGWAQRSEIAGQDGRWVSLRDWYTIESAVSQGFSLSDACWMCFGAEMGEMVYSSIKAADVQAEHIKGIKDLKSSAGLLNGDEELEGVEANAPEEVVS